MPQLPSRAGFTLVELVIVLAIVASISSLFAVQAQGLRLSAHEMSALASLRAIHAAQVQFAAQVAVDVDEDGRGEYGYLAELAGTADLRQFGAFRAPRRAFRDSERRRATALSERFGNIADRVLVHEGYVFQLWLPDADGHGVAEAPGGGADEAGPDPDEAEAYWCAYAWPLVAGASGNRVFFIREDGQVLFTKNRGEPSPAGTPPFDAAYTEPDMSSPSGVRGALDGQSWHSLN